MINILYEPLPETVSVGGRECRIVTDFRDWIRFSDLLCDSELSEAEKLSLLPEWFISPPGILTKEHLNALISFCRMDALQTDREKAEAAEREPERSVPVMDFAFDSAFLIGDFLHFYGIDLMNVKMHWWRFRILLSALPAQSQLMQRIAYRTADLSQIKNESERRRIMRLKAAVALPFELDDEAIGAAFL